MKKVFVDTNIIIRSLTNDHPVLSKNARKFLEESKETSLLYTADCVISECVHVLSSKASGYQMTKKDLVKTLGDFILMTDIEFPSKKIIWDALNIFANESIDWCDILLYLTAKAENTTVFSFDEDIKKLRQKYP